LLRLSMATMFWGHGLRVMVQGSRSRVKVMIIAK
jgi:hypothetical protein